MKGRISKSRLCLIADISSSMNLLLLLLAYLAVSVNSSELNDGSNSSSRSDLLKDTSMLNQIALNSKNDDGIAISTNRTSNSLPSNPISTSDLTSLNDEPPESPAPTLNRLNFLLLSENLEKIAQKNQQRTTTIKTTTPIQTTTSTTSRTTTSTTTTTTTTTTTSITTTTTTTTTPIMRLTPQITEFRANSLTYEARSSQLTLHYLIRTNLSTASSGNRPFQVLPAYFTVDVVCNSSEPIPQSWSRTVYNQTVVTHYITSSLALQPRSDPKPGSLIRCTAQAVDISRHSLISYVDLLIDPAPVSNLFMRRVNQSSLELNWMSPPYFYDYIDLTCQLDEEHIRVESAVRRIQERLNPKATQIARTLSINSALVSSNRFVLSGLVPGAIYNCSLASVRSALNFTTRSKNELAFQMTELSEPSVVTTQVNETSNQVEVELSPPIGYSDHYTINLFEMNNKNSSLLFSKNFTSSSSASISLRLDFLILNTIETLKSGGSYELTASIQRRVARTLTFNQIKSNIRLASFYIKPEPVRSILYFVKSNRSVNITWQQPQLGTFKSFVVSYLDKKQLTTNTWLHLDEQLSASEYDIEVRSCADDSCQVISDPTRFQIDMGAKNLIRHLSVHNWTSSDSDKTGLRLNFRMIPKSESDLCDLSQFRIDWRNVRHNESHWAYLDANEICPDLKCTQIGEDESTRLECTHDLNQLEFNTDYEVRISLVSLSHSYEWPSSVRTAAKTVFTVPKTSRKTAANYDVNASIRSASAISIVEPRVDESTGPVLNTRLYLVRLGSLTQQLNRSEMFTLVSMNDQDYLKQVVSLSSICSNETMLLEPCLLHSQPYVRSTNEKIVLIGRLASNENATVIFERTIAKARKTQSSTINSTSKNHIKEEQTNKKKAENNDDYEFKFDYEHINTSLIEHSSLYQLFYVFEIGDHHSPMLYYASEPSEPIQTRSLHDASAASAGAVSTRETVTFWIVIAICVLSSLFLIGLIATLVVLTLIKYKPSKFHKAAQIVTGANSSCAASAAKYANGAGGGSILNAGLNGALGGGFNGLLRGKFDRSDDFLGVSQDFVVPPPFSRHDMTTIWLVKHANGDLILDEEYRQLPDYRDIKTSHASQEPKNETKNRFLDIKAYDDSRVILQSNNTTTSNTETKKPADLCASSSSSSSSSSATSTGESLSASISSGLSHVSHIGDSDDNGDYINANFVQGYSHEKKFIATQGPKKETLVDFWRMIYQYRVHAIVMLTKLVEKGVERCTQYWPDKLNMTESYGDYEVTMKDQQKCGDYIKRTFDLVYTGFVNPTTLTATPGGMSIKRNKVLTVTQYYYPEWPDKETPSTDPISILSLIRDVNSSHLPYQYPIVVHCSAGVGRTGTYITLDAMMDRIEQEGTVDIFGFISKIRERRQYLVQTSKQYIFIHEALYEYCLYGFTDIDVSHLASHYKSMKERPQTNQRVTAKTRLEIEFERLSSAFVPNIQAREAFRCENKSRNRNLNTICYDENRVRLSSLTGCSYINATKIKGFEASLSGFTTYGSGLSGYGSSCAASGEMIITQDPMSTTLFEFWKMITEYECNIIVALNKDFEKENESVYWPSEEEPTRTWELEDTKFVVQLIKPLATNSTSKLDSSDTAICFSNKNFTRREFEIISHKYSGTSRMTVTHFMLNEQWPEDRAPPSRSAFLDLVSQVQKTLVKYEHSTRIAVHSHGGGSNCSVFCALNILLEQFKNEQTVDVCRTVKKLKTQRPHMIETYDQYEFLYQCLVEFIDKFGIYSQSSGSFHSRNSFDKKSPIRDHFNSIHLNID